MKTSLNLINCRWYFLGLFLFVATSVLLLIIYGKTTCFISLNSYHPYWLNVFFINYTFMGDGIFAIVLFALIYFYFKRKQQGFMLLLSFIISGLAVQLIKNFINAPRPKLFFEAGQYLHFVDGVSLANNSSFPSGHTATAFAIATVLVLMMSNKNKQLLILLAALLVGYSRIYLAQHFLLDVIIGAVIGTASGVMSVYFAFNFNQISHSVGKMQYLKNNKLQIKPPATIQPI